MENIKVFIGDSQVIFREGIHFILQDEPDVEVVGEGRTPEDATAFLQTHPVDVMVMGQNMEKAANRVAGTFPHVGLLLIGDDHSRQQVVGRNSIFLTRDVEPEELVRAVRVVGNSAFLTRELESEEPVLAGLKVNQDNGEAQTQVNTIGAEQSKQSVRAHLLSLVHAL